MQQQSGFIKHETLGGPPVQFLQWICGMPKYVTGIALSLELGQHAIESRS